MMTPEGRVKAEIKAYLTSLGAYQFWPVQTGYGAATVDCLACLRGRFLAIEVKRPGIKKGTVRQEKVLKEVREARGFGIVVDDVAQLRAWLDRPLEAHN